MKIAGMMMEYRRYKCRIRGRKLLKNTRRKEFTIYVANGLNVNRSTRGGEECGRLRESLEPGVCE
jgi:hypothetical protein